MLRAGYRRVDATDPSGPASAVAFGPRSTARLSTSIQEAQSRTGSDWPSSRTRNGGASSGRAVPSWREPAATPAWGSPLRRHSRVIAASSPCPTRCPRRRFGLLKAFGAEVVMTPTAVPPDHPDNYVMKAKQIVKETPGAILANQFYNSINPEAHYATTGPEIWEQTEGKVTHLVAGAGTGGTISGAGKYLKEKNPRFGSSRATRSARSTPTTTGPERLGPVIPTRLRGSEGTRFRPPSGSTGSTNFARFPTAPPW